MRLLFVLAVSSRDDNFVLLHCLIVSGGRIISEMNIGQSHGSDDVNDTPSRAEALTSARFPTWSFRNQIFVLEKEA